MAIVRHISNNCLYEYFGEDKYVNLVSGKSGVIDPDKARSILKINLDATVLIDQYPMIKELINKLQLRCNGNDKT